MNRSITIEAFNDIERFKKELGWVKDAGFRTVGLLMWTNTCAREDIADYMKAIKEELDRQGMRCMQTHLPCYSFFQSSETTDEFMDRAIDNGVKAAAMVGADWAVYHPRTAVSSGYDWRLSFEHNKEALKPLLETAEKWGTGVAVENIPIFPDCPRHRWYSSDPDDLCEIVDYFESDRIGICWDTGHANLMSFDQPKVIRQLGKRIKATHISSNYKEQDWHLPPLFGYIDMQKIMEALRDTGYDRDLIWS